MNFSSNDAFFKKEHYDECRKTTSKMICPEHKRKVLSKIDYDFDGTAQIYITRYCCKAFAEQVAQVFIDCEEFSDVQIEPQYNT